MQIFFISIVQIVLLLELVHIQWMGLHQIQLVLQSPNGNTLTFFTSNMTADTILPIGVFNASLNYYSSPVPLGFPTPTWAFMMDSKDCGKNQRICDMINSVDDDKGMKEEEQDPDFSGDFDANGGPDGGPDGDDYFSFSEDHGDEWFQDDGNYENNRPGNDPDSLAVWVKIPVGAVSIPQPIVHFGDRDNEEDEFGLYIVSGGEIEFQFSTDGQDLDCDTESPDEYDDNLWHHIVGVRDADHSCKLYIDGQLVNSDSESPSGSNYIDSDFLAFGSFDNYDSNELTASIASVMYWNDAALTAPQVEDLYYTNYGNNGTRLYMTITQTTGDGIWIKDIVSEVKIELPFHDASINQDNGDPDPWLGLNTGDSTDLKYSQANMTWASTEQITLNVGERLKLTLDWKGEDEQNLPINILFDDSTGWTLPCGP